MDFVFTTGEHSFLMPSEQIEELEGSIFNTFCFQIPDFSEEHIELEAWKCRWATKMLNANLYIQSDYELVKLVNADGIILKKHNMTPTVVRKEIGEDKVIIGQASNFDDAVNFVIEGVDVLLLGPIYANNDTFVLGLEGLKTLLGLMKENGINIPIWIFGGITSQVVDEFKKLNIQGISVCSDILSVDEIKERAELYK